MTTIDDPLADAGLLSGSTLVREDSAQGRFRVNRDAMTSSEIFDEERKKVFDHSWLYVGHESEVPNRGDYVRRSVGGRPLFMVRGSKTGEVNVFHNTCTHRGAVVCRRDSGNSKVFQCFYHAWTFNSEGSLVGVPDSEAYAGDFDMGQLGLARPARSESYRGFVFASHDPDIVDLTTYLADARPYLDNIIDAQRDAQILHGTHEYNMQANWKLLVENSIDGYHAVPTHDTYFKYLADLGTDLGEGVHGEGRSLGNGHAVIEYRGPWGRPIAKWEALFGEDAKPELESARADLAEEFGE
ncbi:MAG: aromatic ring-hydroxylating dioxygenase subunit alpha, partial [Aeromicrobium sp.]